jgi:CHAT domain-containing protein
VPSLTTGVWLHRRARRDAAAAINGRASWIACPDATSVPPGTPPVAALAFGASELSTWRGDGPPPTRLLRGSAVTMPAMATALADADLAVVLAHGVRDARRRDPQGLLLGDGTVAWGRDLGRLQWPRQVVFAACAAGHGRTRIGDDGLHLLRGAAFVGGAHSVVAPWLDVDYGATLAMLGDLHGALAERGQSLAVALWQARRRAHERGGDAALDALLFHLHGSGDEALAPARPRSAVSAPFVVAVATAVLAATVVALRRRRRRVRYGLRG